ncbi:MAG: phosphate butyryltransferase [Thermotogae bacterium]|uniref:bifunctional enoyl-CoA hydratase/phosphate acetyltransferase n=1 Tax=Kosmotoga sp. TaxID=1955248 RepID=UPI000F2A5BD7|nr:bifunctional enoyl-CoA hydratase/phosphate acetyltransferase [Kosmotoga sp.]MCD6160408.1 bifunctional enoyl-CoA hydratase/phosphate acetyltransferase [Kosmotoga sp.]RKX48138.1 MAG: phosphate butyryltransferase [Thermotogota bacterium]
MLRDFKELYNKVHALKEAKRVVLVGAEDVEGIKALKRAKEEGIADAILVGNKERTMEVQKELGTDFPVIDAKNPVEASEKGVKLISSGEADILMKGLVKTANLLKAVLNKEWGLRSGKLLSHIAVLDVPAVDRLIFVSDGGMVIKPDIQQKAAIIENAVKFMHKLGYEKPRVALIAAVEVINPDMPETMDAAILAKMADRKQLPLCYLDGPLGIDNALNEHAANIKKVSGEVAGKADLLIVPDIHSGNFLGKSAVYLAGGTIAGLILGASAPIVIVSRADAESSKLASIALAVLGSTN